MSGPVVGPACCRLSRHWHYQGRGARSCSPQCIAVPQDYDKESVMPSSSRKSDSNAPFFWTSLRQAQRFISLNQYYSVTKPDSLYNVETCSSTTWRPLRSDFLHIHTALTILRNFALHDMARNCQTEVLSILRLLLKQNETKRSSKFVLNQPVGINLLKMSPEMWILHLF